MAQSTSNSYMYFLKFLQCGASKDVCEPWSSTLGSCCSPDHPARCTFIERKILTHTPMIERGVLDFNDVET